MRGVPPLTTALLATFLTGSVAASTNPAPHVRGINAQARELVADARARSGVVQTFIDALAATDVVVLVSVEPLTSRFPSGFLTFVSAAGGFRYVVVKINAEILPPVRRVAVLAHELQHAVEVASAPEVRDTPTLVLLYRRIGYEVGEGKWETAGARYAGERAQRELGEPRPAQGPFVVPAAPADSSARQKGGRRH